MTLLAFLDHASVFVFALTGALVASRAQLDIVGFVFIAALTAVGGGTLRDLLLDRGVFWIAAPQYIGLAALAAVLVFFTAHRLESRVRAIAWLDACALAVAERMRLLVEALPPRALGNDSQTLTISAGITGQRQGDTADLIIHRADTALYRAKVAGRNRVEALP